MIRYSILALFVGLLCVVSYKDWFKGNLGLIFLTAVIERPDMPKTMLGIPGLNPWNILLVCVVSAWMLDKMKEKRPWALPGHLNALLLIYFLVIVTGVVRCLSNMGGLDPFYEAFGVAPPSSSEIVMDQLINSVKWVVPGLLVFDGCRSEERLKLVIWTLVAVITIISLQVISRMGLGSLLDATAMQQKARRVLERGVGYHRVDLATLLGGGAWLLFCARGFFEDKRVRFFLLGCFGIGTLALILTAGRMGYGAWAVIGGLLAFYRFRSLLILGPIFAVIGLSLVPAARDRIFEGFSEESHETSVQNLEVETVDASGRDLYAITSGRVIIWPIVIDRIKESPVVGYGEFGMIQSGASVEAFELLGAPWAHPHNAYLYLFLNSGFLGGIPILLFFGLSTLYAFRLFRSDNMLVSSVGAIALTGIMAQLIGSVGAQSFNPRVGTVVMWTCLGLTYRYYFFPETATESQAATEPAAPDPRRGRVVRDWREQFR